MGYQGSVLVVDDEIGPRESLRMILHPLYEVYTAADGEEAIDCIQKKDDRPCHPGHEYARSFRVRGPQRNKKKKC